MFALNMPLIHEVEFIKAKFRREVPAWETISTDPLVWAETAVAADMMRAATYFCEQMSIDWCTTGNELIRGNGPGPLPWPVAVQRMMKLRENWILSDEYGTREQGDIAYELFRVMRRVYTRAKHQMGAAS